MEQQPRASADQRRRPDVAIAHDYLTQRGGAERVVLAMHELFPDALIHTSLFEPSETFPEFSGADIRTSALNHLGIVRRHHRAALPLLAPTVSRMRVDADVVICSTSGWAHGVRTDGKKLAYCYAPARWLYQADRYTLDSPWSTRAALSSLRPALLRWDRAAAASVDMYLAISSHTRAMIRDAYGQDAAVVHPPVTIDPGGHRAAPIEGLDPGYLLVVSRLLPYKNVGAVVDAVRGMPDRQLVVVGAGPLESSLRQHAPPNVRFLRSVDNAELRWLYANAGALVSASFEDFGLTPVEAALFGVPSVVMRFGGFIDTVVEGATGVFFDAPESAHIVRAVRELENTRIDRSALVAHASGFSAAAFRTSLLRAVDALASSA